jgi:glucan phosphoethanolaminetransferase (alkaline phosphatase superfamily)
MGLALFFFGGDLQSFFEHFFVLALWISGIQFLVLTLGALRFPRWVLALVPALSLYLLFFFYLSAAIGNFSWGAVPTYTIVFRFLGQFPQIAEDFQMPPWSPPAFLALPLIAFVLFYLCKSRSLEVWTNRWLRDFRSQPRQWRLTRIGVFTLGWVVGTALFIFADPNLTLLGNFNQDPVKGFLTANRTIFNMTPLRAHWGALDRQAELSLRPKRPQVHNIILVIVDALRADHLPAYGYDRPLTPFLSSLQRASHFQKVDWCLANGTESAVGIMSILSSKEFPEISFLSYTLPDFMADNGVRDFLYLSGDHHWYNFRDSYGHKISLFLDGNSDPKGYSLDDDEALPQVLGGLPPDDGRPHFFYFHMMSVHEAGTLHSAYLHYQPARNFTRPDFRMHSKLPQDWSRDATNLYDDRILQADDVLKEILGVLKAKGYLGDYLLVFTADHGELLGEEGNYGHGHFVQTGILHTPLLFFSSRPLPAFAQSRFATELDIAPTLAELDGLTPPSTWQGQSLLHPRSNPWTYHFSPSPWREDRGAVVLYQKGKVLEYSRLLMDSDSHPGNELLMDLVKDPQGQENLIPMTDPGLLRRFRQQALDHLIAR